jgi:hypothetical protein
VPPRYHFEICVATISDDHVHAPRLLALAADTEEQQRSVHGRCEMELPQREQLRGVATPIVFGSVVTSLRQAAIFLRPGCQTNEATPRERQIVQPGKQPLSSTAAHSGQTPAATACFKATTWPGEKK